jgi:teichuronic acid biosynthesis glycosyltransferase TuaC
MRIAVVTTSYPAFAGDCAGHFVREEALELAAQGHEVHVIAPASQAGLRDAALVLWPVAHGGAFGWPGAVSRIASQPLRAAGAAAFVTLAHRKLRDLAPDHVVAHWLVPSAWPIAALGASHDSVEAVAHGADVRALLSLPAVARERIVRSLLDRGARLRFVAHALRDSLCCSLRQGLQARVRQASFVRPVSLAIPHVAPRAAALRATCDKGILASTVGRLVPSKRLELAIEAANLIAPRLQLCVVGDGPDTARLRELDRSGNVRFLGRVTRNEALAWIAASDVLIHPSGVEAAPTVVREARALGTNVVACAAGDVERWAREDSGITIVAPHAAAVVSGVLSAQEIS